MGNCINIGEYNKLYKYIWLYIFIKLIFEYLFGVDYPDEIKIFKKNTFPKSIIVQEIIYYFNLVIFSRFLYIYEKSQNKRDKSESSIVSNNTDINSSSSKINLKIDLIYKNYEKVNISCCSIIFVAILLILSDQLRKTFFIINLKGLDFRMFELLFVCIITLVMFGIPIYKHKKLSIGFILIFCVSMKSLSIVYRLIDDHKKRIFKIYTWLIPVGISCFILISLLRCYTFCKIKELLDFTFISVSKLLLYYGIIGFFISLTVSIVLTFIPCIDNNSFENIYFFCNITDIDSNNSTTYYYENFFVYYKNLWISDRETYINIIYIFLLILRIVLFFFIKLFLILIIKNLSPEYLICSDSIYYFIEETIDSIVCIFLDRFKYYKLYDTLDELFCIIGIIFYLELIEFKFCGLDFNLKKYIKKRSIQDSREGNSFSEENDDTNTSNY